MPDAIMPGQGTPAIGNSDQFRPALTYDSLFLDEKDFATWTVPLISL